MPRGICRDSKKRHRTPTVSIPEGMNGIQLREKLRGSGCEVICRKSTDEVPLPHIPEHLSHLTPNVLGITECAVSLGDPNRAVSASPAIYVLEEVAV